MGSPRYTRYLQLIQEQRLYCIMISLTLRTPRVEYADIWSFPLGGSSLPSKGSLTDIKRTLSDREYPKNLCNAFDLPSNVGMGIFCSKLDDNSSG